MTQTPTSETTSTVNVDTTQTLIPQTAKELGTKYLLDPEAPAFVVYETANLILGGADYSLDAWEPESIWLGLKRTGFVLPRVNEEKILCCSALKLSSEMLTSASVLQNIVLTLNNEIPNVEADEEVDAEELVWGMVAINIFLKDRKTVLLDYPPVLYCAAMLHDEGFIAAPKGLKFCQSALFSLNSVDDETDLLHAKYVEEGYEGDDEVVLAQLEKHARCQAYVKVRFEEYEAGMKDIAHVRKLMHRV